MVVGAVVMRTRRGIGASGRLVWDHGGKRGRGREDAPSWFV